MDIMCVLDGCDLPPIARGLCRKDYYRIKAAGQLEEVAPKAHPPCSRCSGAIPQARRFGAQFCSTRCKDAEMDARKQAVVVARRGSRRTECAWCSTGIEQVRSDQRFCSAKCADDWKNEQTRLRTLRAKRTQNRPCESCGKQIPAARSMIAIYCSRECKMLGGGTSPRTRKRARGYNRERLYGISDEQYDEMLAKQDGRCSICRTSDWPGVGPHVDHCHVTGKVRGILCHKCNLGLGKFNDDLDLMRAAIAYLEVHASA